MTSQQRPQTLEAYLAPQTRPWLVAHRGDSGRAPENTLAAIRGALASGVVMVEIDVALTADHRVVCIHDSTLDRTTDGSGPVGAASLEEIRRLDAGSWFAPAFGGERVPTLRQALLAVRERALLNIELKAAAPAGSPKDLVVRTVEVVRQLGMQRQVLLSAFETATLEAARRLVPGWATAYLTDEEGAVEDPAPALALGTRAVHLAVRQVSAEGVRRLGKAGLPVAVYTVNDETTWRRMARLGVAACFTDVPTKLRGIAISDRD